jgi:cell division septal protein FtsQ
MGHVVVQHQNKKKKEPEEKKPAKKRSWIYFILIGAVLFSGHLGLKRFFHSPYFDVKEIRWRGVQRINPSELNTQFQYVMGKSLIYLNISDLHSTLLTNPWVKEAVVRKVLPNQVDVFITERVPAAVEIDPRSNRMILRDSDGVILEEGKESGGDLPRMIHYTPEAYKNALTVASLLSTRKHSVIDLSRPDDIRVDLGGDVLRFGEGDYQKRWERFTRVEADLKRRHGTDWEADLRFPSKVVVKARGEG